MICAWFGAQGYITGSVDDDFMHDVPISDFLQGFFPFFSKHCKISVFQPGLCHSLNVSNFSVPFLNYFFTWQDILLMITFTIFNTGGMSLYMETYLAH